MAKAKTKKRINRQDFFNQYAVDVLASYVNTKSQLKTARALNLPPQMVGYIVARLLPGVIKDKIILKMVGQDCWGED